MSLLWVLTASILLTEVGEPPDVTEANTEAQHGEEELDWTVPGDPGLPWLHVHGWLVELSVGQHINQVRRPY